MGESLFFGFDILSCKKFRIIWILIYPIKYGECIIFVSKGVYNMKIIDLIQFRKKKELEKRLEKQIVKVPVVTQISVENGEVKFEVSGERKNTLMKSNV